MKFDYRQLNIRYVTASNQIHMHVPSWRYICQEANSKSTQSDSLETCAMLYVRRNNNTLNHFCSQVCTMSENMLLHSLTEVKDQ